MHPELARTDAHLIEASREGDDRAFGELYERYGRRIFAYIRGMVRDHARAEDITQDVFVSALRRMRGSERPIAFKPWIYEIAKNASIDEHRRVQRSLEVPVEHDGSDRLVPAAPSPDACFEQQQRLAVLNGAFRGLSERQHAVLVLRELEGRTYADIAARTGMSVPMVESTLLRARRRLSQEYDDITTGRRCEQVHAVVDMGGQTAFTALGLRERRLFARHIAVCQPCARYAQASDVVPDARVPGLVKKIAGLLPFPLARWPFGGGGRGGGLHISGLLRPVRRAAQLVHPGASVAASPATVATVAAIVVAGGGAAAGLIGPGHAPGAHGAGGTAVRPAAVVNALPPSAGTVSSQTGRPGTAAARPGHSSRPGRSPAARRHGSGSKAPVRSSPPAGPTPNGRTPTPSGPSSPSPSPPSVPGVHLPLPSLPPVPSLPTVGKNLLHQVTNPLQRVIKKTIHLPGPLLTNGVGLANGVPGGLGAGAAHL